MKKLACLLPVWRGDDSADLKLSIDSVIGQQLIGNTELTIFFCLDGSLKRSQLQIIEESSKFVSTIIINNRYSRGLANNLNSGLEEVLKNDFEYIARMDADDISFPSRLEKQFDFIEKNNLDICGGHCLLLNKNGKINGLNVVPTSHKMCTLSLFFKVPFAHPSVMIRKKFLDENSLEYGQSSYKIAEDLDLWLRMHRCGARFGNVDSTVLKYRIHSDSLTKVNNTLILKETKAMLRQFYKDNYQQIALIIKSLPSVLNTEEKSLLVRYIYRRFKRLDFSDVALMKKIDKKVVFNSILSEMLR